MTTYGSGMRRGEMELREQSRSARGKAPGNQWLEELASASVREGGGRLYQGTATTRTIIARSKNRDWEERSLMGRSSAASGARWPHRRARCGLINRMSGPLLSSFVALFLIGATKPSFAQPSTEAQKIVSEVLKGLVQGEGNRISNQRTGPMADSRVREGAPDDLSTPITENMRPENFMGTDPGSGVANYLEDSLEEGANILQCLDFKFVPGCFCFSFPFVYLAYEYRAPLSRYEAVRQPFQSDYLPTQLIKLFQQLIPNEAISLFLASTRIAFFQLGMKLGIEFDLNFGPANNQINEFKLSPPEGIGEAMKAGVEAALSKIPNPEDNKGRGGGTDPRGRSASAHGFPTPLAIILKHFPFFLGFPIVKSNVVDLGRFSLLPAAAEDPLHVLFARSPATSFFGMPSIQPGYMNFVWNVLKYPTGAASLKQLDWVRTFNPTLNHTTGMPLGAFPTLAERLLRDEAQKAGVTNPSAVTALVANLQAPLRSMLGNYPHLPFGNDRWFPMDSGINTQSEPIAAATSSLKMGKLACNTVGYPDLYDLDQGGDRFQYVRGDKLSGGSFRCGFSVRTFEEFGEANVLERKAEPITMSHWKRYTGCPPGALMFGSCPWEKIDRQQKCNVGVQVAETRGLENNPWPWEPWKKST